MTMKYSKRFKKSVLRKVLPENRSVPEVAREMGISDQTIYNWKKMLENGEQLLNEESSPSSIGRLEKFNLLLEPT
jgi:transposase-like protein